MPCYRPIDGYYAAKKNPNGKRSIVFDVRKALSPAVLKLPCGKCPGCLLERSRQWAVRCMHESKMHPYSSFVTLTYRDDRIPPGGSLRKRDLQLFMKRLRKKYGKVRFYACGEYGTGTKRPHYHLLLFGLRFDDLQRIGTAKGGEPLYCSDKLAEVWPDGYNFIGQVTFESCQYVAKYILKKVDNATKTPDYLTVMTAYGEVIVREPEFTVMSRRPGIGMDWFDQYHSEVYAYDSVISNGHEAKPPRFYDVKYELLDFEAMEVVRRNRRRKALMPNRRADNTKARLRVREAVELRKLATFGKRQFL
ncbi:VP4 [Gokushovirus WZ-2015a]|nr:VP4 [Gokushovirus WZ-2015a]